MAQETLDREQRLPNTTTIKGMAKRVTILSSTATQDTRAQDGNEPKKRRKRHWTENSMTAKSDSQGTKEGKYLIRTKEYRAQSKINDTTSGKAYNGNAA